MRIRVSPDLSSRSVTLAATEWMKALVAVIIESLVNIAIHRLFCFHILLLYTKCIIEGGVLLFQR